VADLPWRLASALRPSRRRGVGIGLTVCRRLVESHGGHVWAAPRAGGGGEFGFALPLASVESGRRAERLPDVTPAG